MVNVTSEVGRLRKVLVHEPGPEVDRMVPSMMEELLFDDILFGERARDEHRRFRRLLQLLGVEVLEAGRMLGETLAIPEARSWLTQVLLHDTTQDLRPLFNEASTAELASILVAGRRQQGAGGVGLGDLYSVAPLANWCFQRDPQVVLGKGVVFAAMATPARWREAMLMRAIFQFHPELAGTPVLLDPLQADAERPLFLGLHRPRLEGGDVLVLSREVVAVGVSERTNTVAVSLLARSLARAQGGPRWLLVVHLPQGRAFMHLDTVFTPIDRDAALVYPPLIEGPDHAQVYEIDLQAKEPEPAEVGSLLEAAARRGVKLEPVACGGNDPVHQQREQWTDGANALAVAPGVVILYDRNVKTAESLAARGFRVLEAEAVLLGQEEVALDGARRTCILLSSNEISRARGGPHCLSHPIERDDLR